MAHDRLDGDEVPLTHDFLSMMLGTRRASVTDALHLLGEHKAISTKRSCISILDRPGLEKRSCECYAVVKRKYDRLLPAIEISAGSD